MGFVCAHATAVSVVLVAAFSLLQPVAAKDMPGTSAAALAAPHPNGKHAGHDFLHRSKETLSETGKCILKNGVPQHLLEKGLDCAPSAAVSAVAFVGCAGLAAIPEARTAVQCFKEARAQAKKDYPKSPAGDDGHRFKAFFHWGGKGKQPPARV